MKGSGIILMIALIAGAWFIRSRFQTVMASATTDSSKCIAVTGITTTEDESRSWIIGNVRNDCERRFSQVTVNFGADPVAGPTGDLPATPAYAYIRNVEAGETRSFKTAFPIASGVTYRLSGINAF